MRDARALLLSLLISRLQATILEALLPLDALLNAAADACDALPVELLFSRERTPEVPHLEVLAYTRRGATAHMLEDVRGIERAVSGAGGRLLLYVPGWWNTPTDDSTRTLADALLMRERLVLVLDTRLAFCRGYLAAASRVRALALSLANALSRLLERGVRAESVHLLGFSLGAHVVGVAGDVLRRKAGHALGAVTGLDPARPCFARSEYVISRSSAELVQVWHTSALGVRDPAGHVDVFMPGDGRSPDREHARAWQVYASSARGGPVMAKRCRSRREAERGSCEGNHTAVGYHCSAHTRGLFMYSPTTNSVI